MATEKSAYLLKEANTVASKQMVPSCQGGFTTSLSPPNCSKRTILNKVAVISCSGWLDKVYIQSVREKEGNSATHNEFKRIALVFVHFNFYVTILVREKKILLTPSLSFWNVCLSFRAKLYHYKPKPLDRF